MHFLQMRGSWGRVHGWAYEQVVGAGSTALYDRFVEEAAAAIPSESLIIDVGCGQGQIASRLARRLPDCGVIGFDLSPDMVLRAQESSPHLDNLEFRVGDALSLPLDDESVDAAVSVASIKHWPDRLAGVRELVRVLKPGGLLCILEVDRDCTFAEALRFARMWHLPRGTVQLAALWFQRVVAGQALNLNELVGLLARAGIDEIEERQEPAMPFIVALGTKQLAG